MSEDDEEFHGRSDGDIPGEHARSFIPALSNEFDEGLVDVLDAAPYFRPSTVTDPADRDEVELVQLPPSSPDMNPAEECCRQLKESPKNRFVDDLDDRKRTTQRCLSPTVSPKTSNYL